MKLYLKQNCPVTGKRAYDTADGRAAFDFEGGWVFVTTDRGTTVGYPLGAIHALELGSDGDAGPRARAETAATKNRNGKK